MFKVVDIVCDGRNFLVLRLLDLQTEEEFVDYFNFEVDLRKEVLTREDLRFIWR